MKEMDDVMAGLGVTVTDRHINDAASQFTERLQVCIRALWDFWCRHISSHSIIDGRTDAGDQLRDRN
jgi:hypothetical protein